MAKELITQYEKYCNEILKAFCEKQEMNNEGWVGEQIGGIAMCSDFFFNFLDIVWDLNSEQPKGKIIEWYDTTLDAVMGEKAMINYVNFCKQIND